mmetsp:Transcript_25329/g.31214  ORF Transcript_25329/g.31214 Transcript_25329/m.31214 type:complete len:86 (-) Transcript_25329:3-260(-)
MNKLTNDVRDDTIEEDVTSSSFSLSLLSLLFVAEIGILSGVRDRPKLETNFGAVPVGTKAVTNNEGNLDKIKILKRKSNIFYIFF